MKIAIVSKASVSKAGKASVAAKHEGSGILARQPWDGDVSQESNHYAAAWLVVRKYVEGLQYVAEWSIDESAPMDGGGKWAHVASIRFRRPK